MRLVTLWLICSVMLVLQACGNQVNDAQLQAWLTEAENENQRLTSLYAPQSLLQSWQLQIQGEIGREPVRLDWSALNKMATDYLLQKSDANPNRDLVNSRGILVSHLLDRLNIQAKSDEITFLAFDAYRSTIKLADIQKYPIMLVLEYDGHPLTKPEGGPLFLKLPYELYPNLASIYPGTDEVFYTTHIIVGNEPAQLKVGNHLLNSEELNRFPQTTINTPVGYRRFWPSESVKLSGIRIRDLSMALNLKMPLNSAVIVRGKAPIHRDKNHPASLPVADLQNCDIILATHWGKNLEPIPSKMGGPIALAFPPNCSSQVKEEHRWLTFVEELEVALP